MSLSDENPFSDFRDKLLRIAQDRFPDGLPETTPRRKEYRCPDCRDTGYTIKDLPVDHPDFGKLLICHCRQLAIMKKKAAARDAQLESIDGLVRAERRIHFDQFIIDPSNEKLREVIVYLKRSIDRKAGFVTMIGDSGIAKSALMAATVNECKTRGTRAIFITMVDLLDELRKGFNPNSDMDFDDRWDLLRSVDVLCIDEVDKFNSKPWAQERFNALVNDRWRYLEERLTLMACNNLDSLEKHIVSRMGDGRGRIFRMQGEDFRPKLR